MRAYPPIENAVGVRKRWSQDSRYSWRPRAGAHHAAQAADGAGCSRPQHSAAAPPAPGDKHKPIPAKAHHCTFNLRESKIVQGVRMRPNPIPNKETLAMLWAYKALRVFSDRLIDDSIDDDDRKYFVAAWASTHSRSRSR